jgi:hypothetical protein
LAVPLEQLQNIFLTRKETKKKYSRELEQQDTIPNTIYIQYALQTIKLLPEQFVKAYLNLIYILAQLD